MIVGVALVIVSVGIGASGHIWPGDSDLSSGVFYAAATSAVVLAWIVARRRNVLGLLAVLITVVIHILIKVWHIGPETHAIVWDGQFDAGPALAQFAAFVLTIIVPAWVAVGIDALTAPPHPHAGAPTPGQPFGSANPFGPAPTPFGPPATSAPANPFSCGYSPTQQPPSWPGGQPW